jgi:hypothetical protein
MGIVYTVSPTVRFKVEGVETAEDGGVVPIDFMLTAERLAESTDVVALRNEVSKRESGGSITPITDVMLTKIKGWSDVRAKEGQDVPFSEDACRHILNRPGIAVLAYDAYIKAVGARAKNS